MDSSIERIGCPDAPAPAGHYAQATAWRDLVFVSGQLPGRPDGSHTFDEPFEVQVRQALTNLFAILNAACCGPDQVLRVGAYIVGVENWPAFDRIYAEMFGAARPARIVVPVPDSTTATSSRSKPLASVPAWSPDT